jgi:hypothetical protein
MNSSYCPSGVIKGVVLLFPVFSTDSFVIVDPFAKLLPQTNSM